MEVGTGIGVKRNLGVVVAIILTILCVGVGDGVMVGLGVRVGNKV